MTFEFLIRPTRAGFSGAGGFSPRYVDRLIEIDVSEAQLRVYEYARIRGSDRSRFDRELWILCTVRWKRLGNVGGVLSISSNRVIVEKF